VLQTPAYNEEGGMGAATFGRRSIDDLLAKKASGLKHVKAPTGVAFKVEVVFDPKVEKAALKDPLLIKEFEEAAEDTAQKFVEFVGLKMKATDEAIDKLIAANKLAEVEAVKKKMNADIEAMRGSAIAFGVAEVNKAWTELGRKTKEYTKYKIKIGVTIGAAVAGMITSIALLAATPWTGGASAVLSIIGIAKSAVTIAKEAASAAMEVETAVTALKGELAVVKKIWATSKAAGHANEVTAAVVTQFIGRAQPNIKECQGWSGKCEQKVNGIVVNNHGLSKKREEMKAGMSKLHADFMAEAKKRLAKHPSPAAKGQIGKIEAQYGKAVAGLEQRIIDAGNKIDAQRERAKKMEKVVGDLKKEVDQLAKSRGVPYKVIDNLLLLTDIAVSGLSGNNLVQSFNDMASSFGSAAASLAIDRLSKAALEGTVLE
jgi:hypothetical protein